MGELHVPITGLYAALQTFVAIALLMPLGRMRGQLNVSLGSGGNPALEVAIRRHANWAEHVPFALLLIGLVELNGGSPGLVHGLGAGLLLARILHPLGLKHDNMRVPLRGIGAIGTLIVDLIAAIALLLKAF
jgi:uncharacterized protein